MHTDALAAQSSSTVNFIYKAAPINFKNAFFSIQLQNHTSKIFDAQIASIAYTDNRHCRNRARKAHITRDYCINGVYPTLPDAEIGIK
jgi:hypothetical protein